MKLYKVFNLLKVLIRLKRLGGPKYIKKRASDREFLDWCIWAYKILFYISLVWWLIAITHTIFSPVARVFIGLNYYEPVLDDFKAYVLKLLENLEI